MDNKPYFFYSGIKELATTLSGKENIYLGIRPYGFHAGNKIPFVIYPMLLCEEMEKYPPLLFIYLLTTGSKMVLMTQK